MNEQQIEWLRTHQIMHCPAAPEVGLPFHKGTEADAIANYAMMGETLDLNADTSLVPGSVLAVRRAKQRKQREETKMGRQRREIDLESLKADYEGGMPGAEMQNKYKISRTRLSTWARRAGCVIRRGSRPQPKPQRKAAMVKVPQSEILRSAQNDKSGAANDSAAKAASANGHTRCRVAMFEVEGDQAAVLAAIEAVKTALSRAA
jgi:hypothetical protein